MIITRFISQLVLVVGLWLHWPQAILVMIAGWVLGVMLVDVVDMIKRAKKEVDTQRKIDREGYDYDIEDED